MQTQRRMKPAAKFIFLIMAVAVLGGGFNLWRSRGHSGTIVEKITGAAASNTVALGSDGFDAGRLIPVGNGPNRPIASNSTSAGRAKNRRTDIKVIAK